MSEPSQWPVPPEDFDPVTEILQEGTTLFRVHPSTLRNGTSVQAAMPNPGKGPGGRFSFFGDPVVPVLYAASTPEGAVYESIRHSRSAGSRVPSAHWRPMVLSAIEVRTPVDLASFHSDGLRRFGLYPRDLTDTPKRTYPYTVKWAEAVWKQGLAGVAYMSRHFNSAKAYCLFGDRIPSEAVSTVDVHPASRAFDNARDIEWLAATALSADITLRPDL